MTNTVFDWTFDAAFENPLWLIDGSTVLRANAEVATFDSLVLSFRVTSSTLLDTFRALKPNEGQVDTFPTDGGGFVAVDRANGGNTFTLDPPSRRLPIRRRGDYHVRRYEEELVSQTVEEWNLEIEFVPAANRTDTPSGVDLGDGDVGAVFDWTFDQVFSSSDWAFETRHGKILTSRVDAEFIGRGENGVRQFELITRLTQDQAWVWEASINRLNGVRVRPIADGSNLAVDDTDNTVNTVTIIPPTPAEFAEGDYTVLEWEGRRINDAYNEYTIRVART